MSARSSTRSVEVGDQISVLTNATVEAISSSQVLIRFVPTAAQRRSTARYKVEWSTSEDFDIIAGSTITPHSRQTSIVIGGLSYGERYTFRITALSLRGMIGCPVVCVPHVLRISCWNDDPDTSGCGQVHRENVAALYEEVEKYRSSTVWQRVFPKSTGSGGKKKRGGFKNIFSSTTKFVKHVNKGTFLASIVYTDDRILCTMDDTIPIMVIDDEQRSISNEDTNWLVKASLCWDQVAELHERETVCSSATLMRSKIIDTVLMMQKALEIRDLGRIHHHQLHPTSDVTFIITVQFLGDSPKSQSLTKMTSLNKFLRKKTCCDAVNTIIQEIVGIINTFEASQIPVEKGLYLCYLKLFSSLSSLHVVVPSHQPNMMPFTKLRDNPHVTKEEWDAFVDPDIDMPAQRQFLHQLLAKSKMLASDLGLEELSADRLRFFSVRLIQVHEDVSMILLLPQTSEVCVVSTSTFEGIPLGCITVPLPSFELFFFLTYNPIFIHNYVRLSLFLEHYIMITHYEQRQCLLETDAQVYGELNEKLTFFQNQLDQVWKQARWLSQTVSLAREKNSHSSVETARYMCPNNENPIFTPYILGAEKMQAITEGRSAVDGFSSIDQLYMESSFATSDRIALSSKQTSCETLPCSPGDGTDTTVIRVYAAYNCGLTKGTSVRLQVSPSTTSKEVVELVVEQISKITSSADPPIEFCLVVVIGARERRLRDDFPPLKLQNPWSKGKLFVRRRQCLLAAIQNGNEAAV
uniref:Fibronectin type-III domain-containing protein n=1 Tax=Steinernema glaseri TaxID=37863 RepID=A0A1I7YP53_9BILA